MVTCLVLINNMTNSSFPQQACRDQLLHEYMSEHFTKQICAAMPILLKEVVEKQPTQITLLFLGEAGVKSGLLRSLQCFGILLM